VVFVRFWRKFEGEDEELWRVRERENGCLFWEEEDEFLLEKKSATHIYMHSHKSHLHPSCS